MLDINELITSGQDGFISHKVTGRSAVRCIESGYLVFIDRRAKPCPGCIIATSVNGLICVEVFGQSAGLHLVSDKPHENRNILGVVRAHLAVY